MAPWAGPELRTGSFLPELLDPPRRGDRALWTAIMTHDAPDCWTIPSLAVRVGSFASRENLAREY